MYLNPYTQYAFWACAKYLGFTSCEELEKNCNCKRFFVIYNISIIYILYLLIMNYYYLNI